MPKNKKILYVGPSWAYQSFDPVESNIPITNLNLELEINAINLSGNGLSNLECIDQVQKFKDNYDAIFWVYCEPIKDIEKLGISSIPDLVQNENFWSLRSEANCQILKKISNLSVPIAIVGAHSDIVDCSYPNITVIHDSWQKYLESLINSDWPEDEKLNEGWGAEIVHSWIHNMNITRPSMTVLDRVSATFFSWTLLERAGLWHVVHPSKKGNELFSSKIKASTHSWLNNI